MNARGSCSHESSTSLPQCRQRSLQQHRRQKGIVVRGLAIQKANELRADIKVVQLHVLDNEQCQLTIEEDVQQGVQQIYRLQMQITLHES